MTISATMLNFTQNQRFHQCPQKQRGKFGTMTKAPPPPQPGQKNAPASQGGRGGVGSRWLLSGDRAHGAGALASTTVDAGGGIDLHVVVAHGDRAHGAGAFAGTAGNASVVDHACHVTYTSKCRMCLNRPYCITSSGNCNMKFEYYDFMSDYRSP